MQFKYRNPFPFLGMMLALLEMAQSAMPQRTTKTTGPNTKQGTQRVSIQHCINIKRKQLRKYVVKFRKCLSKLRIPSRVLVMYQSRSVARGFIMLKPIKNIWKSNMYLTLLLYFLNSEWLRPWSDCKYAQASLRLCCSQSRKVRVSRVFVHMMLNPRLPGLRLATCLPVRKKNIYLYWWFKSLKLEPNRAKLLCCKTYTP